MQKPCYRLKSCKTPRKIRLFAVYRICLITSRSSVQIRLPQLLCVVRKLTAVGYSNKPVSCSNAKHRLFSYFPAISRVSTTLQRLIFRSQLSPNQPLSGATQRQILSESLGYENRWVNDSGRFPVCLNPDSFFHESTSWRGPSQRTLILGNERPANLRLTFPHSGRKHLPRTELPLFWFPQLSGGKQVPPDTKTEWYDPSKSMSSTPLRAVDQEHAEFQSPFARGSPPVFGRSMNARIARPDAARIALRVSAALASRTPMEMSANFAV